MTRILSLALLFLCGLLPACDNAHERDRATSRAGDMEGLILALNAKGCIAKTPDGQPLELPVASNGEKVVIPKGSTFTPECLKSKGSK